MGCVAARAWLVRLLLVAIAVGSVRPALLGAYGLDRAVAERHLARLYDRGFPGYARFLRQVGRWTRPGDRIAIVVPSRDWESGYAYAFFRASYLLADRDILPVVWRDGSAIDEAFARADYVASWKGDAAAPGPAGIPLEEVVRGADGVLYRVAPSR